MKTINELIDEYASILGVTIGPARDILAYKLKVTENQIRYAAQNETMTRKYVSKHVYSPVHSLIQNEINRLKKQHEEYTHAQTTTN